MACGIYCIENKVNNKKYIGLSHNIENRWKSHIRALNCNKHINSYLQSSWNKYGENSFDFYIIEQCADNVIKERERYYISLYNTLNREYGYNQTSGGDGVKDLDFNCVEKISISETLYPVVQLDKMGNLVGEYRNCRVAAKAIKAKTENIRNCCNKRYGCKTIGGFIWMYKFDYEQNACDVNYYKPQKCGKPVNQYTIDGKFITMFRDAREAERQTGCSYKHISSVCTGKRKTCGGYIWRFANDTQGIKTIDNIINSNEFVGIQGSKPIARILSNGDIIKTFVSIAEAARFYNINKSGIGNVCKGKLKQTHGMTFKFLSLEELIILN